MASAKEERGHGHDWATTLTQRFDMAVFLIAVGLREKETAFEADPHRYPYSPHFRRGLNMFAELCAEHAEDDPRALLEGLNESGFIRDYCTRDVADWMQGWSEDARAVVSEGKRIEVGPLAEVDGAFFSPTDECLELIITAEDNTIGAYQEREVYEYLRAASQEQYVLGRWLLISHPLLSWDDLKMMETGRCAFSPDGLDFASSTEVDTEWLSRLLELAYEPAPDNAKICPSCGWTMTVRRHQPHCSSPSCYKGLPARFASLPDVDRGSFRLYRGIMRYIAAPGRLELAIAQKARALGLSFEMWPNKDTCDVLITLPDERTIAIDAKAHANASRLAHELMRDEAIGALWADEVIYVVPNDAEREQPGFCAICDQALCLHANRSCMTFGRLCKLLQGAVKEGGPS